MLNVVESVLWYNSGIPNEDVFNTIELLNGLNEIPQPPRYFIESEWQMNDTGMVLSVEINKANTGRNPALA